MSSRIPERSRSRRGGGWVPEYLGKLRLDSVNLEVDFGAGTRRFSFVS